MWYLVLERFFSPGNLVTSNMDDNWLISCRVNITASFIKELRNATIPIHDEQSKSKKFVIFNFVWFCKEWIMTNGIIFFVILFIYLLEMRAGW